jgi:hypothetical protein
MVWGVITRKGRLSLVFIDRGFKINAEYYKTEVLEQILLPKAQKLYGDEYYSFQQGAPSHTLSIVHRLCEYNLTEFIPKDECGRLTRFESLRFLSLGLHAGTTEVL